MAFLTKFFGVAYSGPLPIIPSQARKIEAGMGRKRCRRRCRRRLPCVLKLRLSNDDRSLMIVQHHDDDHRKLNFRKVV